MVVLYSPGGLIISVALVTLVASTVFQLLACFLAFRLIKVTGKSASWLLVSGALFLMSVRRIVPLYLMIDNLEYINLFNEIIGLILSVLMFGGIWGIKSIFLERRRAEETANALLAEKEMILREVHHRLKNNMTTLTSLLHLQAGTLDDPGAAAALEEAESRVRSMMLLYEQLYRSTEFLEAPVRPYLSDVMDGIAEGLPGGRNIRTEKHLDDFVLDTRRLQTLGIIINELLTNCMKYAFSGRTEGMIDVVLTLSGARVVLRVQDDGIGIPGSIDFSHSTGLGLQLVQALSDQLEGSLRLERDGGTTVILEFDR